MPTPAEFRNLVMQCQPTPQPDKNQDGNFLRCGLIKQKMSLMQLLI